MPESYLPIIELTDLLLPTVLVASFEFGQMSAVEMIRWVENGNDKSPFGKAFQTQVQRFVFDKLALLGQKILNRYLGDLIDAVVADALSSEEKDQLETKINELIDELETHGMNTSSFTPLLTNIIEIVELLAPRELDRWKKPLATIWLSLIHI